MRTKNVGLFISLLSFLLPTILLSQTGGKIISLSQSIGTEIDPKEKEFYQLFPDIKGFRSAQIVELPDGKYRIDFIIEDNSEVHQESRTVSGEAIELTRLHIQLTDEYAALHKAKLSAKEAEILYRLALKYAARKEYNVSSLLFKDIVFDYPQSDYAERVKKYLKQTDILWKSKKALFRRGSLTDQSGRTEILIFSGYYGLWLGIATPVFLETNSPQVSALGLLVGGPLSVMFTNAITKDVNMSDGRATMIALGGHLGTWQGIGWTIIGDHEGSTVVGMGEIVGLAGIAASALLTNKYDFSNGHAELTSSGLPWGAWFGMVLAGMAKMKGDNVLRSMLLGSDIMILGTALTAKNVRMSKTRVRLINMAGALGAVFGFGVNLLFEVDDVSATFAIAGASSIAGLVIGRNMTRNFDKGKELTLLKLKNRKFTCKNGSEERRFMLSPKLSLLQHPVEKNRYIPAVGLQFDF